MAVIPDNYGVLLINSTTGSLVQTDYLVTSIDDIDGIRNTVESLLQQRIIPAMAGIIDHNNYRVTHWGKINIAKNQGVKKLSPFGIKSKTGENTLFLDRSRYTTGKDFGNNR